MAITPRRTAAGQTVQGGLEASSTLFRFHSSITPTFKPETKASRPFGSKTDTTLTLMKEHGEASLSGDNIILAELPYLLGASLGNLATENLGGGLYRRTCTFTSVTEDNVEPLKFQRGSARRAETINKAVCSELSLSVSKNSGASTISATLLGSALDTTTDLVGAAIQTITLSGAPTSGTFTITVLGKTTGTLAKNATAAQVESALNAVLGGGFTKCSGGPLGTAGIKIRFIGATGTVAAATTADTFDVGDVLVTVNGSGTPNSLLAAAAIQPGQFKVHLGTDVPTIANPGVNSANAFVFSSFELSISDLFVENHVLDGNGSSPKEFLPTIERKAEVKVWVDADDAGIGLINSYRTDEKLYVTGTATLPNGHALVINVACQVGNVDDLGEESGAYGYAVTLNPVDETTWGGSMQFGVTTAQSTL